MSALFHFRFLLDHLLQGHPQSGYELFFSYTTFYFFCMFFGFLFLWNFPTFVSKKLIPHDESETTEIPMTFENIQTLCFSVIGFWFTVNGFLNALGSAVMVSGWGPENGTMHYSTHISLGQSWFGLVQLLIGIGIMIGSKGISKFIQKIRS